MSRILYISYTGLLDPLGQSQVLQYVLGLAKQHRMTLLTFEKPLLLKQSERLAETRAQCERAGVQWHQLTYHNKPIGAVASLYDLVRGRRQAIALAMESRAEIVHCRSYIAGIMGLGVKRALGTNHIFDMRGFWPDERVDGGVWRKGSLVYRFAKYYERRLFTETDYIVSLTGAGVEAYEAFDYLDGRVPPSSVIPTCTNLDLFHEKESGRDGFTLGYVGSVGSWYLFDQVAEVVSRVFKKRQDARFLVITGGSHELVRNILTKANVDLGRVELRQAAFEEVPGQIARMDVGIFFYRPTWSKLATCPTRMGEFLACGKPCLTNDGVGDVSRYLKETGAGIVLPVNPRNRVDLEGLETSLDQLISMAENPDTSARCRKVAEEHFSLGRGVDEYDRIYRRLSKQPFSRTA